MTSITTSKYCSRISVVLFHATVFWGAKKKYFQGDEDFFSGIWGDQCIILGSKGAQNPMGVLNN